MKANLNTYIMIGGFVLNMCSAVGSYFKALSDIRAEITTSRVELLDTVSKTYASKEETKYIGKALEDIKGDLKDIKQSLFIKGR